MKKLLFILALLPGIIPGIIPGIVSPPTLAAPTPATTAAR
jgi:hypothetical protein